MKNPFIHISDYRCINIEHIAEMKIDTWRDDVQMECHRIKIRMNHENEWLSYGPIIQNKRQIQVEFASLISLANVSVQ